MATSTPVWFRLVTLLVAVGLVATACVAANDGLGNATLGSVADGDVSTSEPVSARGVALTPRSYEGSDLPDFLNIIDGSVGVLMHAGDWGELEDGSSAFHVMSGLAAQRGLATMVVLSPSNGTGLLRPLDESTVASYLTSLEKFLGEYQPDYLALGNELNLVDSNSPADFAQTVELYRAALPIVRERSPDTVVLVTMQYEWMRGRRDGWFGRDNDPANAQWDLLDEFRGADAIGITTYPGLVFDDPRDVDADYYNQIRSHTDLPIIISESGWSADPESDGLGGSEDEQERWARSLLAFAREMESPVVIWTFLFSSQVEEPAFAHMGLWRSNGDPRPAWQVWVAAGTAPVPTPIAPSSAPGVVPSPSGFETAWAVSFEGQLPLTVVADSADRPFVYVAAKAGGMAVIQTEGPAEVVARVSRQDLGASDAMHLVQQGELLVVALGDFFGPSSAAGLAVIDIRDPERPVTLGSWHSDDVFSGAADVVVASNIAYLAAMEDGVLAIDISEPAALRLVGHILPDPDFPTPNPGAVAQPNARGLAVEGNLLYVANDAGGLRVLDVSDPAAMREVGRYINPHAQKQQAYNDVLISGGYAFVSLDYCGFEVIDIGDPAAMTQTAWLDPWGCNDPTNLWFNSAGHGNELYLDVARSTVWMSAGDSELVAIDVSDLAAPAIVAQVGEPGNNRASYGLGASQGVGAQIYLTYITAIVPFQGSTAEVVALAPTT